ncbi:CubicO group peptidase, beta-lactamase class C family [Streptomyces sp. 2323.1]|uniref:serine hydrolase domain-containing protein n=1 Tax=Streptomyces sp. 2323.1 TaxID=1938841 RepID=UPI000BC0005F|nr:serine hydrolase domain-containing protein [Streptomyces sp. 2323.1]SOE12429.1 CubicO group peptidase, beta-lactamase class C family [Streptomyces sp. 2323.1]
MTIAQSRQSPEPGTNGPGAVAAPDEFAELLPQTRRALLRRLAVGQSEGRAPSMMGAVVRDGRAVWTGARGAVDGEAPHGAVQYRIGSLTKTFVAVLVLRLRDEGLLRLEDPLGRHLDGTPVPNATIAQLLAHGSGLTAEARGPWWERTDGGLRPTPADLFGERPQRLPAGRRHHYSNPGYALLGMLVERLRGDTPWYEVLRSEVLEPLGMSRTTLRPQPPSAGGWAVHPWADALLPEPAEDTGLMGPAGQLWSTLADLCRWAAFLLRGDGRVLCAASLAAMRMPAVPPEGSAWDAAYGLGVQLVRRDGRLLAGHLGSMPGYLAALWTDVDEDVAGVVLTNCTSGPVVSAIAADLTAIVTEHEPRIPEPWRPLPGPLDRELLALTGPWYWGANPHVLRLRDERELELAPLSGVGRSSRFRPEADGTWTGLDGYYAGETLRVVRDEDGSVSHLDLGTFVFTRGPYEPSEPVPGGVDPEGWRV